MAPESPEPLCEACPLIAVGLEAAGGVAGVLASGWESDFGVHPWAARQAKPIKIGVFIPIAYADEHPDNGHSSIINDLSK